MANQTKLTTERKKKFLECYRKTRSISRACVGVQISRPSFYEHINPEDPKFDKDFCNAVDDVKEQIKEEVMESALEKAIDGWEEPVFYQGEQTETKTVRSDYLHGILLKGFHREELAERNEFTGPNGGPMRIDEVARGSLNKKLDGIAKRLGVEIEEEETPEPAAKPTRKKVAKKRVAKKKAAKKKAAKKKTARRSRG